MRFILPVWAALLLAACQSLEGEIRVPSQMELEGAWKVQSMSGQPVEADSRTHLEFSPPPRLTGNAGCNRFFGVYYYREGRLVVQEALGASKMLCRPSLMLQEQRFMELLPRSDRIQLRGGQLEVYGSEGELLITAEPMQGGYEPELEK